jgi:photosystem II stability/assembly factor-like uncharacterized protein
MLFNRLTSLCTLATCLGLASVAVMAQADSAASQTPMAEAEMPAVDNQLVYEAPLAAASLVLDITQSGDHYVAVGERGHVLLSDDGSSWRQVLNVPTRSTLTAVFSRGDFVWAVGHDAVILRSSDGGEHWQLQFSDPEAEQPLMDITFTDDQHGIAVGAYSLLLSTDDGGANWEFGNMLDVTNGPLSDYLASLEPAAESADAEADAMAADNAAMNDDFLDEGLEYHLNAILDLGDAGLLIAAEAGTGYRSVDGGASWYQFAFPYQGSMFGLIAEDQTAGDQPAGNQPCVLAYGLRGHVQRSCDAGASWTELNNPVQASLFGATAHESGIALVGANGTLVYVDTGANQARPKDIHSGEDLASIFHTPAGLVIAGEDGISFATGKQGEMAVDGDQS